MTGFWTAYPGADVPGILFLEAFGQLSQETDRNGIVTNEEDLYSVFRARAELMGWSTMLGTRSSGQIAEPRSRPVFWSMHEAELSAGNNASRIGWVQVGLEMGVEPALVLLALIQCFDDALRRFGVVELSCLQVTASSLQVGKESSVWDFLDRLNWFNAAPGPRAEALIAFDNGLLRGRSASEFVASLQAMNSGSFEFGPPVSVPPQHSIEVPVEAPIHIDLSPAQWGASVGMPEWSASAAAWVLAFVSGAARAGRSDARNFAVRLTRIH